MRLRSDQSHMLEYFEELRCKAVEYKNILEETEPNEIWQLAEEEKDYINRTEEKEFRDIYQRYVFKRFAQIIIHLNKEFKRVGIPSYYIKLEIPKSKDIFFLKDTIEEVNKKMKKQNMKAIEIERTGW